MTEDELRKFDKETFVQFFATKNHSDYLKPELERIQYRLRLDALFKTSGEILEEMQKIDTSKSMRAFNKWSLLWEKHKRIRRKIYKLLNVPKLEQIKTKQNTT